jgi:hypothetical protein
MPTPNQGRRPSLTAEFGTPGDARAAMKALENHGIDGLEIATPSREGSRREPADRRTLVHVSGRAGKGIVMGALFGAALFALVGVVFLVVGWPLGAAAALVLAGTAIGGTAGAFIGVERGVGMSEDWEKTFEEPADATKPMRIGVYTSGDAETMRARHVLEHHRPLDIRDLTGSAPR